MAIYFYFYSRGVLECIITRHGIYSNITNQQPQRNRNQPATATPYTHITYPIILFHYIITIHDNSYYTRHTFAPIVLYTCIYNIIYLSTILYPISYLTSYTRAIISKRQPTARPDTLYRYIYYLLYEAEVMERIPNMSIDVRLCRKSDLI